MELSLDAILIKHAFDNVIEGEQALLSAWAVEGCYVLTYRNKHVLIAPTLSSDVMRFVKDPVTTEHIRTTHIVFSKDDKIIFKEIPENRMLGLL